MSVMVIVSSLFARACITNEIYYVFKRLTSLSLKSKLTWRKNLLTATIWVLVNMAYLIILLFLSHGESWQASVCFTLIPNDFTFIFYFPFQIQGRVNNKKMVVFFSIFDLLKHALFSGYHRV